jgi:hypothetical protein
MNTSKVTTIASMLEIVEILWYPTRQLSLFKLRTHAQLYVYQMNTSEVTTLASMLEVVEILWYPMRHSRKIYPNAMIHVGKKNTMVT